MIFLGGTSEFHYGQVVLQIHLSVGQVDFLTKFDPCIHLTSNAEMSRPKQFHVSRPKRNVFLIMMLMPLFFKPSLHVTWKLVKFDAPSETLLVMNISANRNNLKRNVDHTLKHTCDSFHVSAI